METDLSAPGSDLDEEIIAELRASLTATMRADLLREFEDQQARCVDEIAAAVLSGDRESAREKLHLLGGSGASLGAGLLCECCERHARALRDGRTPVGELQLEELRLTAAKASATLHEQLG